MQPIELLANIKTSGKPSTDGTINVSGPYTYCELNVEYKCLKNFVIAGLYFSISGAVLSDKAIINPLIPLYSLAWQKDDEIKLSISKTFHALKKSLQLLDQYYAEVNNKLVQKIFQTFNPKHPLFPE
ncbi:5516_t:CDS:2, partial [Dentiscutata heterogama]